MVGLFVDGWYPSEEKAVMIIPLFTMAASLLTMAFPILMLISGSYISFVPWLILISDILLGLALLSTFSQRRVLILHRGVHLSAILLLASVAFVFVQAASSWFALALSGGLFVTTFRVASKTSAGYGVQFRKEWIASKYLKLNAKRLGHWKIINAKPTNGLMAISRTSRQLAVMYCRFDDDECWLHLDVFSQDIFNLEHFLFEEA
ncbi:MAG: hypothetical protein CMA16_02185 [Euryarchaeota archaeon]|nr:hypothetical protein [Euryarchaeota archaeon]|tara:strand:+ start:2881 stop:3495 length:615 start_codon:yes stop_codon:yes gene_type:complete